MPWQPNKMTLYMTLNWVNPTIFGNTSFRITTLGMNGLFATLSVNDSITILNIQCH